MCVLKKNIYIRPYNSCFNVVALTFTPLALRTSLLFRYLTPNTHLSWMVSPETQMCVWWFTNGMGTTTAVVINNYHKILFVVKFSELVEEVLQYNLRKLINI